MYIGNSPSDPQGSSGFTLWLVIFCMCPAASWPIAVIKCRLHGHLLGGHARYARPLARCLRWLGLWCKCGRGSSHHSTFASLWKHCRQYLGTKNVQSCEMSLTCFGQIQGGCVHSSQVTNCPGKEESKNVEMMSVSLNTCAKKTLFRWLCMPNWQSHAALLGDVPKHLSLVVHALMHLHLRIHRFRHILQLA